MGIYIIVQTVCNQCCAGAGGQTFLPMGTVGEYLDFDAFFAVGICHGDRRDLIVPYCAKPEAVLEQAFRIGIGRFPMWVLFNFSNENPVRK